MKTTKRKYRSRPIFSNGTKLTMSAAVLSIGLISMPTESSAFSLSSIVTYLREQLMQKQTSDAIKTLTAQESVGTSVVAENRVKTAQTDITAEARLEQKNKIINNYNDFLAPSSRTSFSGCEATNTRKNDGLITQKKNLMIDAEMFDFANAGMLLSEYDKNQSLLDIKADQFCSLDLASIGFCTTKISDALYYDVDLSAGMSSGRLTETQIAGGKVAAATIANPIRNTDINQNCDSKNENCMMILAKDNERVAVNSLVSYSLLNQLYNRMAVNGTTNGE